MAEPIEKPEIIFKFDFDVETVRRLLTLTDTVEGVYNMRKVLRDGLFAYEHPERGIPCDPFIPKPGART